MLKKGELITISGLNDHLFVFESMVISSRTDSKGAYQLEAIVRPAVNFKFSGSSFDAKDLIIINASEIKPQNLNGSHSLQ